jgi:hypothetical protein
MKVRGELRVAGGSVTVAKLGALYQDIELCPACCFRSNVTVAKLGALYQDAVSDELADARVEVTVAKLGALYQDMQHWLTEEPVDLRNRDQARRLGTKTRRTGRCLMDLVREAGNSKNTPADSF